MRVQGNRDTGCRGVPGPHTHAAVNTAKVHVRGLGVLVPGILRGHGGTEQGSDRET